LPAIANYASPTFQNTRKPLSNAKDGVENQLPLDRAQKFSVFDRENITLSIGDRIRFTKNVKHRGQKFLVACGMPSLGRIGGFPLGSSSTGRERQS